MPTEDTLRSRGRPDAICMKWMQKAQDRYLRINIRKPYVQEVNTYTAAVDDDEDGSGGVDDDDDIEGA